MKVQTLARLLVFVLIAAAALSACASGPEEVPGDVLAIRDYVEVAELPYAKTGTGVVKMVLAVPQDSPIGAAKDIAPGSRITTEFPKAAVPQRDLEASLQTALRRNPDVRNLDRKSVV